MNLAPFIGALIGGIMLLLSEMLADRFELDKVAKIGLTIILYALSIISLSIVGYGGLLLLGRVIINVILFVALLLLPVTIYKELKR